MSTSEPPHLHVIEQDGEYPQAHLAGHNQYPDFIVEMTDKLHDKGHLELAHLVLTQYRRTERLIQFARFLVEEVDAP